MTVSTSREPARIAGMFDAIAWRYDALNHVLSVGLDRRWRRRAVAALALTGRERVLDLCCGTGDLAIEAATSAAGRARDIVGLDFAGEMLRFAQPKMRRLSLDRQIRLVRGDATCLPLPAACVDVVMIGFGIRNVIDHTTACREIHRVLRPGGRLMILEFGMPRLPGIRAAYRAYFRYLLPRVGGAVSKHGDAYSYLPASVEEFPAPPEFVKLLEGCGFGNVQHRRMTLGIVSLFFARKPAS
ncbi:MAG TPA: bifunctional demethylmenaquinone methyltransferase/2-methoxy-6-polyprenyl-1,4-benzoquinol methylase UbiE [Vicinamibacterales bacterium]